MTLQINNLIFCSLFGASFMLIACSEVKILKKKNECYLHGYGAMWPWEKAVGKLT